MVRKMRANLSMPRIYAVVVLRTLPSHNSPAGTDNWVFREFDPNVGKHEWYTRAEYEKGLLVPGLVSRLRGMLNLLLNQVVIDGM